MAHGDGRTPNVFTSAIFHSTSGHPFSAPARVVDARHRRRRSVTPLGAIDRSSRLHLVAGPDKLLRAPGRPPSGRLGPAGRHTRPLMNGRHMRRLALSPRTAMLVMLLLAVGPQQASGPIAAQAPQAPAQGTAAPPPNTEPVKIPLDLFQ